ncbi:FliA/WhiG family RNA polymerase sigma factor [Dethiosulfovibrio sp. F2B]|uniref:sigma-70 family RNA polymerase sigma factor n=1 Tax=Dethiosulfovibrio faecalis TaxID=2720018 RepID=UPI001F377FFC|nr:FliA/WhiG family RNA polymerase sigma factor [Dethiosulfovibrio faecalis]MCF4150640.1 FliA/WhiG family RNA polymerase sigma factor [Dethiosulfovibrio faecalis]
MPPSKEDEALWQRYRLNPSEKDEIVSRYIPLVKYVVARMTVTPPPGLDYEDLVSFGLMGLLDAIDRFEIERGFSFQTFAVPRIRGAILDELRKCDWFSRTGREKLQRLERATERLMIQGIAPDDESLKKEMDVDDKTYREMLSLASRGYVVSLDEVMSLDEGDVQKGDLLSDTGASAQEVLENREDIDRVTKALHRLSERERLVLSMYYLEEMTLKEIGLVLGVTESRVSQIHGKAIVSLKARLSVHS